MITSKYCKNYFQFDVIIYIQTFFSFLSRDDDGESRPVERAIEARSGSEDGQGSMVRCLHFAHTYIANRKNQILIKKHWYTKAIEYI